LPVFSSKFISDALFDTIKRTNITTEWNRNFESRSVGSTYRPGKHNLEDQNDPSPDCYGAVLFRVFYFRNTGTIKHSLLQPDGPNGVGSITIDLGELLLQRNISIACHNSSCYQMLV
jgi:hypothetical protein